MDAIRGIRALLLASTLAIVVLLIALTAAPRSIAKDSTPAASPAACAAATPGATPAASATPCPEGTPKAAAQASGATIGMFDIYYEPKEATIPANSDATISLPNKGVTLHNFVIDALKIQVDVNPGESKDVVINAPAGEYEFYCSIPGHKAAGMAGTLTVK